MKTIEISMTKRMLPSSPVSRGCKRNVTPPLFAIQILSILLYSACSSAGTGEANGEAAPPSPLDPIIITSYAQLKDIKNGLDKNYRLGSDIDASASWSEGGSNCDPYLGSNGATANCEGFEPIGSSGADFTGNFDGAGHTIKKLYINRTAGNVGMFGSTVGAEIKDVGLESVYISSRNPRGYRFIGGLVGRIDGSASVSNSYVTGSVAVAVTVGVRVYVGGLVGRVGRSASVSNSCATSNVIVENNGAIYAGLIGGLVGEITTHGSVSNSYATGDMDGGNLPSSGSGSGSGSGGGYIGGLVGRLDGSASVSDSHATGATLGGNNGFSVGGLFGELHIGASITGKNYFTLGSGPASGVASGTCPMGACVSGTKTMIKGLIVMSRGGGCGK